MIRQSVRNGNGLSFQFTLVDLLRCDAGFCVVDDDRLARRVTSHSTKMENGREPVWFSREDVMRQLESLGYTDVPPDVLADFISDLTDMAKQEHGAGAHAGHTLAQGAGQPATPAHPAEYPGGSATRTTMQRSGGSHAAAQHNGRLEANAGAGTVAPARHTNTGRHGRQVVSAPPRDDGIRKRKTATANTQVETNFSHDDQLLDMFAQVGSSARRFAVSSPVRRMCPWCCTASLQPTAHLWP